MAWKGPLALYFPHLPGIERYFTVLSIFFTLPTSPHLQKADYCIRDRTPPGSLGMNGKLGTEEPIPFVKKYSKTDLELLHHFVMLG